MYRRTIEISEKNIAIPFYYFPNDIKEFSPFLSFLILGINLSYLLFRVKKLETAMIVCNAALASQPLPEDTESHSAAHA